MVTLAVQQNDRTVIRFFDGSSVGTVVDGTFDGSSVVTSDVCNTSDAVETDVGTVANVTAVCETSVADGTADGNEAETDEDSETEPLSDPLNEAMISSQPHVDEDLILGSDSSDDGNVQFTRSEQLKRRLGDEMTSPQKDDEMTSIQTDGKKRKRNYYDL